MRSNGMDLRGAIAGGRVLPGVQPAFEFNEYQFRQMLAEIKKMVIQNGGVAPIVDPSGMLALGLVMDKLNAMDERLTKIETAVVPMIIDPALIPHSGSS